MITGAALAPTRLSRFARALKLLAVVVLGCSVHALLLAMVHAGWQVVLSAKGSVAALTALGASAAVVVSLAMLAPSVPWWGGGLLRSPVLEETGLPAWRVALLVGAALRDDRSCLAQARRDALILHAAFAAPSLAVAVALAVGGLTWVLPSVVVLLSPALVLTTSQRMLRGQIANRSALALAREEAGPPPRGVPRVMAVLALSSTALGIGAALLLGVPATTRLAGTCVADAWGAHVDIPSALPGTPLFMGASADAIVLSAADGGGPGRVPLATCSALTCNQVPTRAVLEQSDGVLVITLCSRENAAATPQQLTLAPHGYRLDDGIARRVLRSPASVALALALVLLSFAYSRWGFRALLRWAAAADAAGTAAAPSPHARTAVLWALALGGVQLAWLLVTWLGP